MRGVPSEVEQGVHGIVVQRDVADVQLGS
jgi:hypothetical protein